MTLLSCGKERCLPFRWSLSVYGPKEVSDDRTHLPLFRCILDKYNRRMVELDEHPKKNTFNLPASGLFHRGLVDTQSDTDRCKNIDRFTYQ